MDETIRNTFFRCKLIYAGVREKKEGGEDDVESHTAYMRHFLPVAESESCGEGWWRK
jgi:hypothetical protein